MAIPATEKSSIAKDFVEKKRAEGHHWLHLYKNRSGQSAFTIYDPLRGNPTSTDSMFLVSDVDSRGGILPGHLKIGPLFTSKVVGIEFDALTEDETLLAHLEKAFEMLQEARPSFK